MIRREYSLEELRPLQCRVRRLREQGQGRIASMIAKSFCDDFITLEEAIQEADFWLGEVDDVAVPVQTGNGDSSPPV